MATTTDFASLHLPASWTTGRPRLLLQALVIVLAVFWIYWPARNGGWISDDLPNITQNPTLQDPSGLWTIWFHPTEHVEFYPIEESLHWLQWQLFGNHTLGYHLVNTFLHALNALLVWFLLRKLRLRWAWLGGLLFAIHPVMVESIAWLSEFKNALSLAPFLLAMAFWIDFEENHRQRDYFAALGLFLVAMLCKISMAPFPILILLYAWWKRSRINGTDLLRAIPFFIISVTLGIVTIKLGESFSDSHMVPTNPLPDSTLASRLACAGLAATFYLKQIICPVGLMPVYPPWHLNPPSPVLFLPWLGWPALLIVCWTQRATWGRHALLGLGFFLLMIAPFLGINQISYMSFTWVMDHFLYLPSIGLIGLLIAGLSQLEQKMTPQMQAGLFAVIGATTMSLALGSNDYAAIYRSQEVHSLYALERNPGSWTSENNLGTALSESNRPMEAIAHFQRSLELKPGNVTARYNLGNTFLTSGHYTEAVTEYMEVIAEHPNYPKVHNNLAVTLVKAGHATEAIPEFEAELKYYPDDAATLNNLHIVQQALQQAQAAKTKSSP